MNVNYALMRQISSRTFESATLVHRIKYQHDQLIFEHEPGFQRLAESINLLRAEATKAGLKIAGRPLALFVETDDNGFKFEAMLPVDRAPDAAASGGLANGVRAGLSPSGRSLRFVHTAPYDDIDSTYETITAYLEAKNIVVKDAFLEEYVGELKDPGDPNLEINVYVQPK